MKKVQAPLTDAEMKALLKTLKPVVVDGAPLFALPKVR